MSLELLEVEGAIEAMHLETHVLARWPANAAREAPLPLTSATVLHTKTTSSQKQQQVLTPRTYIYLYALAPESQLM